MKGWMIFVSAFVLYLVSVFGGFVQDDLKVISGDPEMGTVKSLINVWTRPYYYQDLEKTAYRPVTSFSFYLNSLVTGKGAWGFRLGNVMLYSGVCWLVYVVLRILLNRDGFRVKPGMTENEVVLWEDLAFWGAMVFVVLPIHTEVVNNVVGRAEILSLGFLLLAILENYKKRWDLSAMFLILAMLSKETAVVGVPVLIYLSLVENKVSKNERIASIVLILMALVGFMMMRLMVLGVGGGIETNATIVENPLKFVSSESRVMNGISLIPFGIGKIFFPVNLSYDYSYNQIKPVSQWYDWRVLVGILMMICSGIYLYRFRVKPGMTLLLVGMILFWGPILITGNILFPIGTVFGERLWFLPSLGILMVILSGVYWMDSRLRGNDMMGKWMGFFGFRIKSAEAILRPGMTMVFLVIILFAGRTFVRNLNWLSQEKLFIHDGKYATESVLAQSNTAAMYLLKNDLETGKKYMEKADKIYPKYPELLNNWGLYYMWTGNVDEGKRKLEECLVERPGNELCRKNMEIFK